jgi:hypothetical protein
MRNPMLRRLAVQCGGVVLGLACFPLPIFGDDPNLEESALLGGKLGIVFRDLPEQPATLTGVIARVGPFGPWGALCGVQGIFETPSGAWTAPVRGDGAGSGAEVHVEAKQGYAVGAIEVRYDERPHGMRLIFMRKKDERLDKSDQYRSRWIGGRSGEKEATLGGDGRPITGFTGRVANDIHALGVLQPAEPTKE